MVFLTHFLMPCQYQCIFNNSIWYNRFGKDAVDKKFIENESFYKKGRSVRFSCETLRCLLWSSLTVLRSCFYPKECFTLEPGETRLSCQMCYSSLLMVARKTGNSRFAARLSILMPKGRGLSPHFGKLGKRQTRLRCTLTQNTLKTEYVAFL